MRISTNQYQQQSVFSILEQQAKLSKTQEQLATGRRILSPSDDPAGSARALDLQKSIATIERYTTNAERAEHRLNLEESVLAEVGDSLQRIRELTLRAKNATQDNETRGYAADEIRETLKHLIELANSSDGNGEYLFAGSQTQAAPFSRAGVVQYEGDALVRMIQVGPSRQVASTHSGDEIFMGVPTGDGTYSFEAASGNTGSGVIGSVEVTDATVPPGSYSIEFRTDTTYRINGTGPDLPYQPGDDIVLPGAKVVMSGEPKQDDVFTVEPSTATQSVFTTVDNLIAALEMDTAGPGDMAEFQNITNGSLDELDQAMERLFQVRAENGSRLKALEQERNANEAALLEMESSLSKTQDLDYAEAVSRLNLQLTGLQAAQQSYTKIQGLSLFNYLR